MDDVQPIYHIYKLDEDGSAVDEIGIEQGQEVSASTHWVLPSTDFHNLWDTLIYDSEIKEQARL